MAYTSYPRVLEILKQAQAKLPKVGTLSDLRKVLDWVSGLSFAELRAADAACAAYFATGQWQPHSAEIDAQIHMRFCLAVELCEGLIAHPRGASELRDEEAAQMMVVENWYERGLGWAQAKFGDGAES